MPTLTKHTLSQSISARRIGITAQYPNSATMIHVTAPTLATLDEVWLYAHNGATVDIDLTIMWGLSSLPPVGTEIAEIYNSTVVTIPFLAGRTLIIDGQLATGGLSAAAYAAIPDAISVDGFINRVTT